MYRGIDFKVWEKPYGPFLQNIVEMAWDMKMVHHYTEHGKSYWIVSVKATDFNASKINLIKKKAEYYGEYTACWEGGCFEPTAADGSFLLFSSCGEELHEVCQTCTRHMDQAHMQLLKTMQWIDLTPGEEYWEKVAVWQKNKHWYSQKLENCSEGDYESDYHDYIAASEHLGPFKTEEAAIEAAKNYEEE